MRNEVVVIGAGGHGKVVADIVLSAGDRVLGFLDDRKGACVEGLPWLGRVEDFRRFSEAAFVVAIGDARIRKEIAARLNGVRWHTAVHPRAMVSSLGTELGEGTVVMAGAVINPGARIGRHCIVNTGAIVEHDNEIGNFSHISVGAQLCGTVHVGDETWIGAGVSVRNNITICDHVMIGVGGVVIKDIIQPGVYTGTPVKFHKFPAGGGVTPHLKKHLFDAGPEEASAA